MNWNICHLPLLKGKTYVYYCVRNTRLRIPAYYCRSGIDASQLQGTLIILPVANVASFYKRSPFVNPIDDKNLNTAFLVSYSVFICLLAVAAISGDKVYQQQYIGAITCSLGNEGATASPRGQASPCCGSFWQFYLYA